MYKYRFVNIVVSLSFVVILNSCYDNPAEPKPEPKQYIPVDTASRYEWTYDLGYFPSNGFCVVDTSNIFFATGGSPIKYDGTQFITLNMGDSRFYCQCIGPVNKDCIFFGGEIRTSMYDYLPVVKRYINGKIDTYYLPTDTNESIYGLFGISPEKFWAFSIRGIVYYFDNGNIREYDSLPKWSGHFTYLTPEGRLLLFINSWYSETSKGVTTVKELIGDNMINISSDTLNINEVSLIYQLGQDIITLRRSDFYYYDGYKWIKFFNFYDLDPYFLTSFQACGGKSRNEFIFDGYMRTAPLLLKDGKWSREILFGFEGYSLMTIYFYNDRVYYSVQNYQTYTTCLYKGKLKNY